MADIQTRFTLKANAEGFDQARRQVSNLNDAMSKVAETQSKIGNFSGQKLSGSMLGAHSGGRGGKGGKIDPLSALMAGLGGGSAGGKNLSKDSNTLLNLIKRLEQAQKHATDVSVEGLRKEADAANKTANALSKRNRAREGGGGGGSGGGGGGGGSTGGADGGGGGGGGGRFGKYRESFSQGFLQKVSGIDFMQGGMQGVAQVAGGFVGSIASKIFGAIAEGLGGMLKSPLNVLSQGSGAIVSLAQSMPGSSLYGGAVQQNVDFAQQEISNQRSLAGLLPFVGKRKSDRNMESGTQLVEERKDVAEYAERIGGMNPNEAFSALASAVAGSGGTLNSSISTDNRKLMLALNRLGISDLGTSATILRSQQLGYGGGYRSRTNDRDPVNNPLLRGASDARYLGLEGSESQQYLRSIAEGIHSMAYSGIKFDQAGRSDTIRALMLGAGGANLPSQRAINLEPGFRDHLRQLSMQGPQSAEDVMLMKAANYDPEKGAQETARVLKFIGREENAPALLANYMSRARKIANVRGGDVGDAQMTKLLQGVGVYASLQEGESFRRYGKSEKDIKSLIKSQGSVAIETPEEIENRAAAITPEVVRPSIKREGIGFETGANLAPDVQALDAKQGEFNRQLTSTTRAFAEFSWSLSDFVTRLTGIGAPVTQSRPMSVSP